MLYRVSPDETRTDRFAPSVAAAVCAGRTATAAELTWERVSAREAFVGDLSGEVLTTTRAFARDFGGREVAVGRDLEDWLSAGAAASWLS